MYIQKTKNIIEFLLNGGKDLKIEEELLEQVQQFSKTIETGEIEEIPKSISNIFNLSWNSSIDIEHKEQFLSLLFILYAKDLIDIKILKENFQHFQLTNDLKHEYVIMSFLIYSIKNNKSKEIDYIQYLNFCREIGIRPRYFSEFKTILEKLELPFSISQKDQNLAEKLEKVVKFLQEKSNYLEEFIPNFQTEVLEYLDFFIDYKLLSELDLKYCDFVVSKLSLDKKVTIPEVQKKIENLLNKSKYPIVPITYKPFFEKIREKIEPRTVKLEELANTPPKLVKEFASKKAYSCHKLAQKVRITFLGGGGIGNMAILIQHNNDAILLDYGMSVSNYSIPRWHPTLRTVKAILVTHAHLDHIGALPYLMNTDEEKRWYGSVNTKIIGEKLLFNTSAMLKGIPDEKLFSPYLKAIKSESTLIDFFNRFNPLKPKKPIEISPEFLITPISSSHVFGSYGYLIEIFGKRILFTGDFKLEKSNLFSGAKLPTDADVTIFDGTYYNRKLSKVDNETTVLNAVKQNSKVIIPAFSVGRAQEMYSLLEKLRLTKEHNIKIVGLASEITKLMGIPGDHTLLKSMNADEFEDGDIVIAGNGMLQGGTSRLLLEETRNDDNVGVIICGYQAPETLGYSLKTNHPVALNQYSQQIYNLQISGHTTPKNLDVFISELSGKKIMVHTPENIIVKHKDIVVPKFSETLALNV
ncbi:MAG: MBL fold metallo-hydrolase [Candidatus Heimdallarchaeum endolithica]|uniref:MBL fold metallo-hydrolase n=1 Tax=Candidatus Heimdallarchaeum endolithica TaxID=2876572 RepID=A0A9Y1BS37_9ARCH|nr:MAG: MBL fold metallo-hydrolase [Candidatus Heimdallarchaeum endolithica]